MNLSLSYSSIKTYLDCPLRYKYLYVEKRPRATHRAFLLGSAVHAALETLNLLEQEWLAGSPDLDHPTIRDHAQNAYENAWRIKLDEYLKAIPLGCAEPLDQTSLKALFERGQKAVLNFLELELATSAESAEVWVEQEFELPVGSNGIRLKGVIDKIVRTRSGKHIIFDYKTGLVRSQEDTDQDIQLSFYYYLLMRERGIAADELSLVFLEGPLIRSTTRDVSELENVEELVLSAAAHIEAAHFEPRVGRGCSSCEFKCDCPKLVVSMSQVKEFIRCPRQFELKELAKVQHEDKSSVVVDESPKDIDQTVDDPVPVADLKEPYQGIALFSAIEDKVMEILSGEQHSSSSLPGHTLPSDVADSSVNEAPDVQSSEDQKIEQLARRMTDTIETEKVLECDPFFVADLGAIAISGKLGIICRDKDQKFVMHQLKTGKVPKRLYEEDRLGIALIVLLAREKLGLDIAYVKNHYVIANAERKIVPSVDDLKDAVSLVKKLAVSTKRSAFQMRSGPTCSWCEVKVECDEKSTLDPSADHELRSG